MFEKVGSRRTSVNNTANPKTSRTLKLKGVTEFVMDVINSSARCLSIKGNETIKSIVEGRIGFI